MFTLLSTKIVTEGKNIVLGYLPQLYVQLISELCRIKFLNILRPVLAVCGQGRIIIAPLQYICILLYAHKINNHNQDGWGHTVHKYFLTLNRYNIKFLEVIQYFKICLSLTECLIIFFKGLYQTKTMSDSGDFCIKRKSNHWFWQHFRVFRIASSEYSPPVFFRAKTKKTSLGKSFLYLEKNTCLIISCAKIFLLGKDLNF